jgi:transposase-like protein
VWADGIYSGLRAEGQRQCTWVVIGVNERGEKRFLAIEDGVRESTQSWREVLLGLKARGLKQPPERAIGEGALGFWTARAQVFPTNHPPSALRGAQDSQRAQLPAQVGAEQSEGGATGNLDGTRA